MVVVIYVFNIISIIFVILHLMLICEYLTNAPNN